jgi:hypothetical protein
MTLSADGKVAGRPYEGVAVDATMDVRFVVEVRDHSGSTAIQAL